MSTNFVTPMATIYFDRHGFLNLNFLVLQSKISLLVVTFNFCSFFDVMEISRNPRFMMAYAGSYDVISASHD